MKKNKYRKILCLWFFILVDFVIMFFLKEQILTYLLIVVLGIIFTIIFILKEKVSISIAVRVALGFSFEVGLYFLILETFFLIVEMIF